MEGEEASSNAAAVGSRLGPALALPFSFDLYDCRITSSRELRAAIASDGRVALVRRLDSTASDGCLLADMLRLLLYLERVLHPK